MKPDKPEGASPAMAEKIIGMWIDGIKTWHALSVGPGDYSTLCGLDGNDSVVGQDGMFEAKRGQKIGRQYSWLSSYRRVS